MNQSEDARSVRVFLFQLRFVGWVSASSTLSLPVSPSELFQALIVDQLLFGKTLDPSTSAQLSKRVIFEGRVPLALIAGSGVSIYLEGFFYMEALMRALLEDRVISGSYCILQLPTRMNYALLCQPLSGNGRVVH